MKITKESGIERDGIRRNVGRQSSFMELKRVGQQVSSLKDRWTAGQMDHRRYGLTDRWTKEHID